MATDSLRLKNIISDYISNDSTELEIRLRGVTKEMFETVYAAAMTSVEFGDGVLEQSMNVISSNVFEQYSKNKQDQTQYIRRIMYDSGAKISDSLHKKLRLSYAYINDDYIPYVVSLSKEEDSKPFSSNTDAIVRFKVRLSFPIHTVKNQEPSWRLDLTAVKSSRLNKIGSVLKRVTSEIFPAEMTPENYLDTLDYDQIDQFEIEIEHLPRDKQSVSHTDLSIVKKIFSMINTDYIKQIQIQEIISNTAQLIIDNQTLVNKFKSRYGLKSLLPQAVALTKYQYSEIFPPNGYYVTDKADGVRSLIVSKAGKLSIVTHDLLTYENFKANPKATIVDAELITSSDGTPYIYLFDVIMCDGLNLSKDPFSKRMTYFEKATKNISEFKVKCAAKKFTKLTLDDNTNNLKSAFTAAYKKTSKYNLDGLIITAGDKDYRKTTSYKWKPLDDTTIDFWAIQCPKKLLNVKHLVEIPGYTLYILINGISNTMHRKLGIQIMPGYKTIFPDVLLDEYYPIQFSPSSNQFAYVYYHPNDAVEIKNKIIEMKWDYSDDFADLHAAAKPNAFINSWKLVRVREDRKSSKNYFGNDFVTAEKTWQNIINPFAFEELYAPTFSYFTKNKSDIYFAPMGFNSFVKSEIISSYVANKSYVVDLGGGRGADLNRYQRNDVKNTLFVDLDANALSELINRKYTIAKKNRSYNGFRERSDRAMLIHTLIGDFTDDPQKILSKLNLFQYKAGNVDAVVCNFALHYACGSVASLDNFIGLVSSLLKPSGIFTFTVFSGERVFKLLSDEKLLTNSVYKFNQDGVTKFAIEKTYKGKKLAETGQMIKVKLPFSDQMYEEPLVNLDFVIKKFKSAGFLVETNESFTEKIPAIKRHNRSLFDQLTDTDKSYIGLHQYVVMSKK